MRPGPIVAGLLLFGLGAAMLLDTAGIMHVRAGRLVAPFVLIAIGSAMVLTKGGIGCRVREDDVRLRRRGGSFGGVWLIGVGCWLLISRTHVFGLDYSTSWPLLIVLAGLMIAIRGVR